MDAVTDLMEAGIDSLAATELVRRLGEASGLELPPTLAVERPTVRELAAYVVENLEVLPASGGEEGARAAARARDEAFTDTSVTRGEASAPPSPLERPVLFVLSTIRSGSSLLQLCLNAHPRLYAGQELYLLMFDTLAERERALAGSAMGEGLLKTLMELRGCSLAEAEAFLARLGGACPTWRVYQALQQLCAPRLLVDKTPANAGHPAILRRARELFDAPRYIHLVRHPIAAIDEARISTSLQDALAELLPFCTPSPPSVPGVEFKRGKDRGGTLVSFGPTAPGGRDGGDTSRVVWWVWCMREIRASVETIVEAVVARDAASFSREARVLDPSFVDGAVLRRLRGSAEESHALPHSAVRWSAHQPVVEGQGGVRVKQPLRQDYCFAELVDVASRAGCSVALAPNSVVRVSVPTDDAACPSLFASHGLVRGDRRGVELFEPLKDGGVRCTMVKV